MPKKKALWKRETPCLACETAMINYQFMAKSQTVWYDEWLISHTQPVSTYEDYPDVLKTTICPKCLLASNEYSFGVDDYKYFSRTMTRHDHIKEYYENCVEERFKVLANTFEKFWEESKVLDVQKQRPPHTRSRATFEKIWKDRDKYGVPFFTMMFQEPRDYVTALVGFALDRYCQMVRISFDNDVEPDTWDHDTLKSTLYDHFTENPLDMKSPIPRFYYIGTNFLQCIGFLNELVNSIGPEAQKRHEETLEDYWREAYKALQLSFSNDDISNIPCELVDGGMNLLLAKLHFKFDNEEEGKKCLRFAKSYADNRLKRISNKNQQNFVNEVDDLFKEKFEAKVEETEEAS